jgi:hypothetical protein
MGRRSNLKDVAYGLLSSFVSRNNSVGACHPHDPALGSRSGG